MSTIIVTTEPLDAVALRTQLGEHPNCGAVVQFDGVVRNHHQGRQVDHILYECYDAMARKELQRICDEAKREYPIHDVLVAHRVGKLMVGEASLVMFVASPHRKEAFAATQFIINELKKRAPIWKKEGYVDGESEWVHCAGCA